MDAFGWKWRPHSLYKSLCSKTSPLISAHLLYRLRIDFPALFGKLISLQFPFPEHRPYGALRNTKNFRRDRNGHKLLVSAHGDLHGLEQVKPVPCRFDVRLGLFYQGVNVTHSKPLYCIPFLCSPGTDKYC